MSATMEERCLALSLDLHSILKDGKIPDHEHWEDPTTCGNLRLLIAALAKKHFGDLVK